MFEITKRFKFDAGHRVYTQKVNEVLACDNLCACRHLHGHEYKVEVTLLSKNTNGQGMVTDFKHLNWFKKFLDDVFDHKFIFGVDDPFFEDFINCLIRARNISLSISNYRPLSSQGNTYTNVSFDTIYEFVKKVKYAVITVPKQDKVPNYFYDVIDNGIVAVGSVPTAENLAKFFFDFIQSEMIESSIYNPDNIVLSKIRVWETTNSYADYFPNIELQKGAWLE